jgi:hypothetical protein
MATELVFMKMGFRRPTSHKCIVEVLKQIDQITVDNDVRIDLRGCVFSYPLARIIEKIVGKIQSTPEPRSIKIIHGYATATDNHLLPYLIKNVDYIDRKIYSIDELKKILSDNYKITLEIFNS